MFTPVGAGLNPSTRAIRRRARSRLKSLNKDFIAWSANLLKSCE
jgi:hypothetical protein